MTLNEKKKNQPIIPNSNIPLSHSSQQRPSSQSGNFTHLRHVGPDFYEGACLITLQTPISEKFRFIVSGQKLF